VAAARAEGRPVFVDFTADTCLNCKYFEATSINTSATRTRMRELNVALFVADYTDENPQIAEELRKYGSGGVPMYLIYPRSPAASPQVLTSLTPKSILDALEQAGRAPQ
jgi:thiol:disulfide interchange protein DsbD